MNNNNNQVDPFAGLGSSTNNNSNNSNNSNNNSNNPPKPVKRKFLYSFI